MKRIFITFMMGIVFGFTTMFAQVEPSKFFDNTSIALKGGVSVPLTDMGTVDFEKVGVEVEKWINPWLGVTADGNFYIGNNINTYTTFDYVNVNGLVKFNLLNLFGNFNGVRRTFEPNVFTGIGWGHRTAYLDNAPMRNFMTYKAGAEIDFNIGKEKAWAIRLQPAVIWACPNSGKLNKHNGEFEINVGVVYRFKNHDGNRTFTMVRRYDQNEIDNLNNQINSLREENCNVNRENASLKAALSEKSVMVVEETTNQVVDMVMIMPITQFKANSADLEKTSFASIHEMAEYINACPEKTFTLIGYASEEGGEEYNLDLSKRRAESVYNKLVEYGVNPNQLSVEAKGATTQFSEDSRAMNRVVIVEENQ